MSQRNLQAEQKPEPEPTFYRVLEICFFKPVEYLSNKADSPHNGSALLYLFYKFASLVSGVVTILPTLVLGITATLLVDVARVFFATPYFGAFTAYLLVKAKQEKLARYLAPYYAFDETSKSCHQCAMQNKFAMLKSQYFWEALIRVTAVAFSIVTFGLGFLLPALSEAISSVITAMVLTGTASAATQITFTAVVGFVFGEGLTILANSLKPQMKQVWDRATEPGCSSDEAEYVLSHHK